VKAIGDRCCCVHFHRPCEFFPSARSGPAGHASGRIPRLQYSVFEYLKPLVVNPCRVHRRRAAPVIQAWRVPRRIAAERCW